MNILEQIAVHKRESVKKNTQLVPLEALKKKPLYGRSCISLRNNLEKDKAGVIAEFKRRSPSVPDLNPDADVIKVTSEYQAAGAAGISVLTDSRYFGGSDEDLLKAREVVSLPLLRKDFIIGEYQIHEAKSLGADVILLIAALLSRKEILRFSQLAQGLGMEVLLEVHNKQELEESLVPSVDLVGVNNRDLKRFSVSLETSLELAAEIPEDFLRISESGIESPESIRNLRSHGYTGFLIGGNFMKTRDPGAAAGRFIKELIK